MNILNIYKYLKMNNLVIEYCLNNINIRENIEILIEIYLIENRNNLVNIYIKIYLDYKNYNLSIFRLTTLFYLLKDMIMLKNIVYY